MRASLGLLCLGLGGWLVALDSVGSRIVGAILLVLGGAWLAWGRGARRWQDSVHPSESGRLVTAWADVDQGLLIVDADGRVASANPAACSLLGLDSKLAGATLVQAGLRADLVDALQAAAAGATLHVETGPVDNEDHTVGARVWPLSDGSGVAAHLQDVGGRQRLESVLVELVGEMSRELGTPVREIRARAESLIAGGLFDPRNGERIAEAISWESDRLLQVVFDLVALARLEAGQARVKGQRVEIDAIARRARSAVAPLAEQRGAEVSLDLDDDLFAHCDAAALEQILINLLDNAIRHGDAPGRVVLGARSDGRLVHIEVIDDGPGIPPSHRGLVFERFHRVDKRRSYAAGGTGLGLSIVRGLTQAMDGQVGVGAALPRGAIVWVDLPAASA